jgi:hypothetical protein
MAKIVSLQGSGHELYGYPGYGSLLLGSSGLEQNMPPSAGPPNTAGLMGGLMFSGAPYHPGYTAHNIQVRIHNREKIYVSQGADSPPPPLHIAKIGRNHLKRGNYPPSSPLG